MPWGLVLAGLAASVWLQMRAATRRRALEHRLREVEHAYGLLAVHAGEIVFTLDANGCITFASPAAARGGVWSGQDLAGRRLLDLVHSSCQPQVRALLDEADTPTGQARRVELTVPDSAGTQHWFEMRIGTHAGDDAGVHDVVAILRPIAERKAIEARLREAGMTDPLTGLCNRGAFMARLQRHLDTVGDGCIALFDLDHFRAINDRHGHAVGDQVLVFVAQVMRDLVRRTDTVARLGGEKFGLLLPHATPEQGEMVCRRILRSLSDAPRPVGAAIVRVSASAGVGRLGGSLDDALREADVALHLAKAKGRDRLELAPRLRPARPSRW